LLVVDLTTGVRSEVIGCVALEVRIVFDRRGTLDKAPPISGGGTRVSPLGNIALSPLGETALLEVETGGGAVAIGGAEGALETIVTLGAGISSLGEAAGVEAGVDKGVEAGVETGERGRADPRKREADTRAAATAALLGRIVCMPAPTGIAGFIREICANERGDFKRAFSAIVDLLTLGGRFINCNRLKFEAGLAAGFEIVAIIGETEVVALVEAELGKGRV
jgi:hypothetical protein